MEGENERFMKKKSLFLSDTLIQFGIQRTAVDQGTARPGLARVFNHDEIADFDLAPYPGLAIKAVTLQRFELRRKAGTTAVQKGGAFSKRIKAYYLPFKPGEGHTMQLGTNADYFFTPTLNGCTFVCGSGTQNPQVSHLNLQNLMGQIDQPAMDTMATAIHNTGTRFTVRRADYKPAVIGQTEDYQANVVGFRGVTGWQFFIQKYKVDFTNTPQVHTILAMTAL